MAKRYTGPINFNMTPQMREQGNKLLRKSAGYYGIRGLAEIYRPDVSVDKALREAGVDDPKKKKGQ